MICDFGLSTRVIKPREEKTTRTVMRLLSTIPFAAPELLSGTASQTVSGKERDAQVENLRSKTTMSDAYAFGGVVFEVSLTPVSCSRADLFPQAYTLDVRPEVIRHLSRTVFIADNARGY